MVGLGLKDHGPRPHAHQKPTSSDRTRLATASTEEIDRIILELKGVRDLLRSEGEHLNQELDRFHAAKTATKSIGDHLKQSGAVKKR
jgi:hypothetical protein